MPAFLALSASSPKSVADARKSRFAGRSTASLVSTRKQTLVPPVENGETGDQLALVEYGLPCHVDGSVKHLA
jgi:hypothetical protein